MTLDEASRRLERWTQSLLDLSPRVRLIDRADDTEVIPLTTEPATLAAALAGERALAVIACATRDADTDGTAAPADPRATGTVTSSLGVDQVDARLIAMTRAARRGRAEADHVTWLALGVLWWSAADPRVRRAPIVLLPVELRRTAAGGHAIARAGRARINPALAEALRREAEVELFGDDVATDDLAATLDAIATRAAELRPSWAVERVAYLATLSLAGVTLWNDLSHAEQIAGAPLFRRMLGSEPAPVLPVTAPPALGLDADAEQGAVIAAALAGHSLAVLAPPGTGAAQTAANLAAAALADGKTVAVVSTRAAALAAVRRHLGRIGVAGFALELGALDDAGTIAAALAAVADRVWRPGVAALGAIDRRDQVAAALDSYAHALHAETSIGISVHAAVARLVELRTAPRLAPTAIDLPGLDREQVARRRAVLAEYSRAATAVAPIAAHPWCSSTLTEPASDPAEAIDAAARAAAELATRIAAIAALIPGLAPKTRADLDAAGRLFAIAARTPRPGADLIAAGPAPIGPDRELRVDPSRALPASSIPRDPATYVALARRQRKLRDELAVRWTPAIADLGLDGLAARFRVWAGRFRPWRWFGLRRARAAVRPALAAGKLPGDLTIAADLDTAAEERAARRLLGEAAAPARRWFGQLAGMRDGVDLPDLDALDLDRVDSALWWARELRTAFEAVPTAGPRDAAWRALVAQVCAPQAGDPLDAGFAEAAAAVEAWQKALAAVADACGVPAGDVDGDAGHLAALIDQLAIWKEAVPHLPGWSTYVRARAAARAAGLSASVNACESGGLATEQAADAWERAVLLALIGDRIATSPALAGFHGPSHHARAAELADLTRAAQTAVRSRSLARLAERVPRRDGDELLALAPELERAVPRPARALFSDHAGLVARLAPCVLTTPAAFADQVDPARTPFDLIIFIEAGAVPTAVALGALARARTAVVFGQPAEGTLFADAARQLPVIELITQYRSRHEDLVGFARRWVGDRMIVFPAAVMRGAGRGVAFQPVAGDAADAIAAAVLAHLRDPETLARSIGVVGFDRELLARIEQRLDAARAEDPGLERFFVDADPAADERTEPVLVIDADLVHGDARDVIVLAIDRPFDAERRLGAALGRARDQLVVMSAMSPEAATGVLAEFLGHARGLGGEATETQEAASPMSSSIAAALTQRGWIVRHRVGAGPYRIDLAVLDPDDPTRYVLGIETDGAAYGSATAAGDRDRLRVNQLTALGWRLHRIWCLDWWTDPDREAQRAHGAVIAAIAAARQARRPQPARTTARHRPVHAPPVSDATADSGGIGAARGLARGSRPTAAQPSPQLMLGLARLAPPVAPYQAASVPNGRRRPDDLFEPRHAEELGKLIDRVLEMEAPIHLGLLARRVGAYFGVGRVSARITDQVRAAVEGHGRFGDEPDVIWRPDQDPTAPTPVRVAAEAFESRRDIDEVPLVEIAGAAVVVVERAFGVPVGDLVRDAARLLGFARITDRVIERVRTGVDLAAHTGAIKIDGERAVRPS